MCFSRSFKRVTKSVSEFTSKISVVKISGLFDTPPGYTVSWTSSPLNISVIKSFPSDCSRTSIRHTITS